MNCLIAAKGNPDCKAYMVFFFPKSHSDIWSCIMFVWAFMKDYYFYIQVIGSAMLGSWNIRLVSLSPAPSKLIEETTGAQQK